MLSLWACALAALCPLPTSLLNFGNPLMDLGDKVRRVHIVSRRVGDALRVLLSKEAVGTVAVLATLFVSFSSFAAWVSTNATLVLVMLLSVVNKGMFSAHLAGTKFGTGGECEVDTLDPNLSVGEAGCPVWASAAGGGVGFPCGRWWGSPATCFGVAGGVW